MSLLPTAPSGPVTITLPDGIVRPAGPSTPVICPPNQPGSESDSNIPPGLTDFTPGCDPLVQPTGPFLTGPGPVYTPFTSGTGPAGPPGSSAGGFYYYNTIINGDFSIVQRDGIRSNPATSNDNLNSGIALTTNPKYGPYDRWMAYIKQGSITGNMYTSRGAFIADSDVLDINNTQNFNLGQLSSTSGNNIISFLTTVEALSAQYLGKVGLDSAYQFSFLTEIGNNLIQDVTARFIIYQNDHNNTRFGNSNFINYFEKFGSIAFDIGYTSSTFTIPGNRGLGGANADYVWADNISLDFSSFNQNIPIAGLLVEIEVTIPNAFTLTAGSNLISLYPVQMVSMPDNTALPKFQFPWRHPNEELRLCQRYLHHQRDMLQFPVPVGANTVMNFPFVYFPEKMYLDTDERYFDYGYTTSTSGSFTSSSRKKLLLYVNQTDSVNTIKNMRTGSLFSSISITNSNDRGFNVQATTSSDTEVGDLCGFKYFADNDFLVDRPI